MAGNTGLDAFITFGDGWAGSKQVRVEGETGDAFEKTWKSSQLSQYSLGFSLDQAPGAETGNQSGDTAMHAPELKPIQVTKAVDAGSPMIMQALTLGTIFDDVWIWQKKAGASKSKSGEYFWMLHFEQVNISNVEWSADADSLNETITLSYQKLDVTYLPQLRTGALDDQNQKFGQYPLPGAKLSAVKSNNKANANADEVITQVLQRLAAMGYKKK
jgi:type VI protein secretion system component Hcp